MTFYSELKSVCKAKGTTVEYLSVHKFYKGKDYLRSNFKSGTLPTNILEDLASYMGVTLKEYEIPIVQLYREDPKPVDPILETEAPDEHWKIDVKIDEEFGTAMLRIMKDGVKIAVGRSYLYGTDDIGVAQSISYAAHMAYKLIQQDKLKVVSLPAEIEVEQMQDLIKGNEQMAFKDWIKKFENDNSAYGRLARYISSCYKDFPGKGEKDMKCYFNMHKGQTHLTTFQTAFSLYMKWVRATQEA